MKQYNVIEKGLSDLQEQEDRIKSERQMIINRLKDDNIHLDMELQTTNRKLVRKTNELSELKNSFEKLQHDYYFLYMEKLAFEQNYYEMKGEKMPTLTNVYKNQEEINEENENYKKKIKEMNGIIKTLRDKLGNMMK